MLIMDVIPGNWQLNFNIKSKYLSTNAQDAFVKFGGHENYM